MRYSYRPDLAPPPPLYRTQGLDPLGLVAGMLDELGMGDVIDQATHQNPEMRALTVGEAVQAMGLNGLGVITHALYLVPRFFQPKPPARLISLRVTPAQLNDDALGRAWDTLYAAGVTALSSLIATPAAQRLGLAPRFAHLDSTSFHVDGRYNSDEEPDEQVMHITRGYSRDQRPDRNQVMLDLLVEPQAGIPVLMKPRSGKSSDATDFGQLITDHRAQMQLTYGLTSLVADSALYRAENLQKLAKTQTQWITRAPPAQVVYYLTGALASLLTVRQARLDQHSCFILATNALDATPLSPQELLASSKGQSQAERGVRFLKDPQFFASSFYLKKPERIMALLMVMTVCLRV